MACHGLITDFFSLSLTLSVFYSYFFSLRVAASDTPELNASPTLGTRETVGLLSKFSMAFNDIIIMEEFKKAANYLLNQDNASLIQQPTQMT